MNNHISFFRQLLLLAMVVLMVLPGHSQAAFESEEGSLPSSPFGGEGLDTMGGKYLLAMYNRTFFAKDMALPITPSPVGCYDSHKHDFEQSTLPQLGVVNAPGNLDVFSETAFPHPFIVFTTTNNINCKNQ